MGARADLGLREMKRCAEGADPPPTGADDNAKLDAWTRQIRDVAIELLDTSNKYLNDTTDPWGTMAHMHEAWVALNGLMQKVRL